jgi:hypothetical protein
MRRDGAPDLSPREFALLHALLDTGTHPVTLAAEERLYGWGEEVESNVVRCTSVRCAAS